MVDQSNKNPDDDSEQPNMDQILFGMVKFRINEIVKEDYRDIIVIAMTHGMSVSDLQGEMTNEKRKLCDDIFIEFFSNEENDYATIKGKGILEQARGAILEAIINEYNARNI